MILKKEKHAIIGMGKTGLSIVRFLQGKGVTCVGFDEQLKKESMASLNIESLVCHTGKLADDALLSFDAIWVSPGIPYTHPALAAARQAGIPVEGDLTLFLQHCDAPILAITGTNGKTTTTQTIHTLLETLSGGCDVGGNIGTPMLDLLAAAHPSAHIVLELSSFQLERCSHIHPKWAVLLNVQADHADMHRSPQTYCDAKLTLFKHQAQGDTAMIPTGELWDDLSHDLLAREVTVHRFGHVFSPTDCKLLSTGIISDDTTHTLFWSVNGQHQTMDCKHIPTRGLHQHINLAIAAQAASDFGVSQQVIREAISSFRGLPHRLRLIGEVMEHTWFDDSKATNPAAANAALSSFEKVIWICGGLLKGLNLDEMTELVKKHVSYAVIIGKHPEPYIRLMQQAGVNYTVANTMQRAVHCAAEHAEKLPVLLSPAAASMDQFKNYAERGKAFQEAIAELSKKA
ncbi:MAG: UDP-N-acetylmuramoyl-L-alanine--D-glutamate ligase [Mariprofundaceae bacterium]|nr:UDP-N-acetylmuramoyl-L-alanine--D-glutamate ligase [Mariprofundaceae bacterium]